MFIYNKYDKNILFYKIINFKFQLIDYLSGKLNENEFKVLRLREGLYRQKLSYMYRISIPYGNLYIYQLNIISYISKKYDKYYLHFTTRTNIQLNWVRLINIIEILEYLSYVEMHSIQTSGNCVRNIVSNQYSENLLNKFFNYKIWAELIRQWFTLNCEFLFLPRKFKIVVLNSKIDTVGLKIHDLGVYIKKNKLNKIVFDLIVGGGLGRTPILGVYIFKNLHWKNILEFCDKIVRVYNIHGFRDNIYKSRIKILLKFIKKIRFINFIKNELNIFNNNIYIINEKELNNFFFYYFLKNNKFFFKKNIKYNWFFLNWIKFNILIIKKNYYFINISNKIYNFSPGDINIFQLRFLYYFSVIFDYDFLSITNKQNIFFFINNYNFYNFFIQIKKFFLDNFNLNLLTDIISCPGSEYCSLGNAKSIYISNIIQKFFINYNIIFNINKISINISGCINSCSHHHISNLGIVGINKNNEEWYQVYIGGQNLIYNNLKLGIIVGPAFPKENIIFIINKIFKFYLINKYKNELFIDTYNRLGFLSFKNYIFKII